MCEYACVFISVCVTNNIFKRNECASIRTGAEAKSVAHVCFFKSVWMPHSQIQLL
jgi:hypothetical protein